jgi:hypothetical protein
VNEPDFEISAGLRARHLVMHVVPDAVLEEIGDEVTVTRREARSGLPSAPERGLRYTDVAIEKHAIAATKPVRTAVHDPQPRPGGVEHNG